MIDADDILPDHITLKKVIPLIVSVIKDDDQFYLRLFLEKCIAWWMSSTIKLGYCK